MTRGSPFGSLLDQTLAAARRNPIAVMLTAAGAGWLIHRMSRRARGFSSYAIEAEAEEIPVLNTGQTRIYDPDASPRHPTQDSLESRREVSARL